MTWTTSETTRLRLASRGGALLVAGLACLLALHPFAAPSAPQASRSANAISIVIEYNTPAAPPQSPPPQVRRDAHAVPASSTDMPASSEGAPGDASSHMWLNNSAGRVHFANEHDYLRCLDAAIAHLQIDGCPPPPTGPSLTDHPPARSGGFRFRETPEQAYAQRQN